MNFLALLSLILVGASAQAQDSMNTTKAMPVSPPGVPAAQKSGGQPAHDDSQIVEIVKVANDTDIKGGKMAQKKSKREDVKAYAKEMVKDHSAANEKLKKLDSKEKIKMTENDTSRGMKEMAKHTEAHLKSVKAEDFDREYMDSELTMHQEVLDSLDNSLIPSAKDESLKALLKDARQMVSEHLEKAKKISVAITSKK